MITFYCKAYSLSCGFLVFGKGLFGLENAGVYTSERSQNLCLNDLYKSKFELSIGRIF
ncbi:hypothetical protein LEP1GSC125_3720 [Leptospira mayottensis 200901122]|uniref:Uncharacterized protein n=1 Tax=Leptospira mayottensis 200901122 TaxID=1193010 RepID=A0AA87MMK2_9LEPT|nr:hypothetical protein LEP1GSC125_3720 [Leptospira mayottensis 200901122]